MEKEITNQYPKIFTDEEFREALKIAKQSGPYTIRYTNQWTHHSKAYRRWMGNKKSVWNCDENI